MSSTEDELRISLSEKQSAVEAQGRLVRELKASSKLKEEIDLAVKQLNDLKLDKAGVEKELHDLHFVLEENMLEVDCPCVTPEVVLKASGHAFVNTAQMKQLQLKDQVIFLKEKPHVKGTINTINFMPWETSCFVTGGSDHAVVLWTEVGRSWTSKPIHRKLHSSSVMGVAGLKQKQTVLSAGSDKRVIAYNVIAEETEFTQLVDSKCLDILPNPRDTNLYMVQTGSHGKQLRLYDIRSKRTDIQPFGWIQASSETQSSLVNQSWSPDGFYITSGSADPVMHIFDIRYNSDTPSQSIKAHQKRVFKAEWHPTLPLLLSISSDLNIGLHKQL